MVTRHDLRSYAYDLSVASSFSRDVSVNVVAGLIGSAIIAALGLLGHRWHLIVERCNGSNAAAAFELFMVSDLVRDRVGLGDRSDNHSHRR